MALVSEVMQVFDADGGRGDLCRGVQARSRFPRPEVMQVFDAGGAATNLLITSSQRSALDGGRGRDSRGRHACSPARSSAQRQQRFVALLVCWSKKANTKTKSGTRSRFERVILAQRPC